MAKSQPVNLQATSADFEFAALNEAKNYRAALLASFRPYLQGNTLEIGAGVGQFSKELLRVPSITRFLAVEPDARFFAPLRERVGSDRAFHGIASQVQSTIGWNAIVSVNVLEHIEDDDRELGTYHSLLREAQGTLCLFVPARPELYAPIDRDFGHFRRYRRSELRRQLLRAGFDVITCSYFNSLGYFAWWVTFKLLRRRAFHAPSVRIYDRFLFPAVSLLENGLGRPPFGQSILAIARVRSI